MAHNNCMDDPTHPYSVIGFKSGRNVVSGKALVKQIATLRILCTHLKTGRQWCLNERARLGPSTEEKTGCSKNCSSDMEAECLGESLKYFCSDAEAVFMSFIIRDGLE